MKKSGIVILLVSMALILSACGPAAPSEGLEFSSNGDGTCIVSGVGTCTDTDIIVPGESPDGETMVSVGQYAFEFNEDIISITLPESVTYLDGSGFFSCDNLKQINMGEIKELVDWDFSLLPSLEKVNIESEFNYFQVMIDTDSENWNFDTTYDTIIPEILVFSEDPGPHLSFTTMEITEDNIDFIYCSLFDKEKITVNGKKYTMPQMDTPMGVYASQKLYDVQFEFGEDNEFKMFASGELYSQGTYSMNETTGCYLIDSGDQMFNFLCYDDVMYMYGIDYIGYEDGYYIKDTFLKQ